MRWPSVWGVKDSMIEGRGCSCTVMPAMRAKVVLDPDFWRPWRFSKRRVAAFYNSRLRDTI